VTLLLSLDKKVWLSSLDDTEPGHYGVEDWGIYITKDDLYVEIPSRSFSLKNAEFTFALRIGSSNDNDGYIEKFKRIVSGSGTFEFTANGKDVKVMDLQLEYDHSLFT